MGNIKRIIAVASGKGGVGKSSVTTNLALGLARKGLKVGLLDGDIYGPCQPQMVGQMGAKAKGAQGKIHPVEAHGISFVSMGLLVDPDNAVVWRAPMATRVIQQFLHQVEWGELDYLLIDLPPGTGDIQITLAQQAKLTGALIVTTPQKVAQNVASKGLQMFAQMKVPILGVIENMSTHICPHCDKESELFLTGGGQALADEYKVPLLTKLPLDSLIVKGSDEGIPVLVNHEDSEIGKKFIDLAALVDEQVSKVMEESEDGPENVTLENGAAQIQWKDHKGRISARELRSHCPCASCVDENTGKKILKVETLPLDINVLSFEPVGRYGLSFRFSDGHGTGIFKFDLLRSICECEDCKPLENFSL